MSDAQYQPVHNLKAVVVNSSSIVLSWEKPVDVIDPSVIKVGFVFIDLSVKSFSRFL